MQIDHVGIATGDADAVADQYAALFGADPVHEEHLNGIQVVFLDCDNGYFELLEPTDDGLIASYIDENGPGMHHMAIATDDIAGALDRARDLGIDLVDETPRPGAWGHEVAFLHPASTGGVLLEFVQR